MTSTSTFSRHCIGRNYGDRRVFFIGGRLTYGEFVSFTLFLGFMIAPIVQMSNIGSQLTEAFAGLDRTQELMCTPRGRRSRS